MSPFIVMLGWGSLLWDKRAEFDEQHGEWQFDGPNLSIEFSRISKTRAGALTLVIDPVNGERCSVAYAQSKRFTVEDAVRDLAEREGTTTENVGVCYSDGSFHRAKDRATSELIRSWAVKHGVDVVVWTDLSSNFSKIKGQPFALPVTLDHLNRLDFEAKQKAMGYIRQAPDFVNTPLRRILDEAGS